MSPSRNCVNASLGTDASRSKLKSVAFAQVRHPGVETVGGGRADGTAGLVLGAEHEVVDQQLRAPVEQLGERLLALVRVELVVLLDRDPRQLAPLACQLVVAARQLLLALEQRVARLAPFLPRAHLVTRHSR